MGSHPINLVFRFILEIAALIVMGIWGWNQSDNWSRYLLAALVPIFAAVLWGVFAVPDDPSRSGKAPIPVRGTIRLALELAFFALAASALNDLGAVQLSWIMAIAVTVHYLLSMDRVNWLLRQ